MSYIVLDTETTNGFVDPICYDVGWTILNNKFNVIKTCSYVVADIFLDEKQLMKEAYFADKIPQYWKDIKAGTRELKTYKNIKKALWEDCYNYDVVAIVAHNARFDYRSCTTTQRWLTSSKYRYFFPYGIMLVDTLKMSRAILAHDNNYVKFCNDNNYLTKNNKPRFTAEIIYRFLTHDNNFTEEHTATADTLIEAKIFEYCMKTKPAEFKSVWDK